MVRRFGRKLTSHGKNFWMYVKGPTIVFCHGHAKKDPSPFDRLTVKDPFTASCCREAPRLAAIHACKCAVLGQSCVWWGLVIGKADPIRPHSRAYAPRVAAGEVSKLPGKEMFHAQVLLHIPCYDLLPVSNFAVVPPLARNGASSALTSHELTGGEYKTQEHIHRDVADSRLLAIPTS